MSEVVTILQDMVRLDFPNEVNAGGEGAATCMLWERSFSRQKGQCRGAPGGPVLGVAEEDCWGMRLEA